jgi:hypothetical protein
MTFAKRLWLNLQTQTSIYGETDAGSGENIKNPKVDPAFGTTWSISCLGGERDDVGEIWIELNKDHTVKEVRMIIWPKNTTDLTKWYGFAAITGFSNYGDDKHLVVTEMHWVNGPDGAPNEPAPENTNISGKPKSALPESSCR